MRELIARAMWERYPDRSWELLHPTVKEQWLGHVDAALVAMEASGWVLVPAEPTEAMLAAGFAAESNCAGDGSVGAVVARWQDEIRAEYLAMLAARPRHPKEQQ